MLMLNLSRVSASKITIVYKVLFREILESILLSYTAIKLPNVDIVFEELGLVVLALEMARLAKKQVHQGL